MVARREFLKAGTAGMVGIGVLGSVVAAALLKRSSNPAPHGGYGELFQDPAGVLDLPRGFQYRILSQEGRAMSEGRNVPSIFDGMGAFAQVNNQTLLIRNHELELLDTQVRRSTPVPHAAGRIYDPEVLAGGTTTLLVDRQRNLVSEQVSLAGTINNCAGGITPWHTWLSCEEIFVSVAKPHGYVFEVDPLQGGNAQPIAAMGRFEHEAVSFDRRGIAYLSEDDRGPHGCFYRYIPNKPLAGRGSLHRGGELSAMAVSGVDTDLSIAQDPGAIFKVKWVDVPNPDPADDETTVREQVIARGATPIQKVEGTWPAQDGSIWFVSSYAKGPHDIDPTKRSAARHSGQIWRYNPAEQTIELVVLFPYGTPYDGPDNITAGPHGYALACTDGDNDQWLVGINDAGQVFPFAYNALNDGELAGAIFSADGDTLFVNLQGPPSMTLAIWGPWQNGQ